MLQLLLQLLQWSDCGQSNKLLIIYLQQPRSLWAGASLHLAISCHFTSSSPVSADLFTIHNTITITSHSTTKVIKRERPNPKIVAKNTIIILYVSKIKDYIIYLLSMLCVIVKFSTVRITYKILYIMIESNIVCFSNKSTRQKTSRRDGGSLTQNVCWFSLSL